MICGPRKSGKSHLAAICSSILECKLSLGADLADDDFVTIPNTSVVIDNADDVSDPSILLEFLAKRIGIPGKTVLSGNGEPREWAQKLTDLATRLESYPRIRLVEPNEELLKAVLKKMFKDRQLDVNLRLISYAAVRIPKTFEAATRFVEACDRLSIVRKTKINQKLAQKVVSNLSEETSRA